MPGLGAFLDDNGDIVKRVINEEQGVWNFDEDDYLLFAMLTDNVYGPELLWDDPPNHEYGGAYVVRDYQHPMYRVDNNYAAFATARSVGKTESIKARAFTHAFRRQGENLLVTAPELIHLLPLTDAIESRIHQCRLTRDFLETRNGKTGFTHRPFGVDYVDGTKIVGRIPRLSGTGVKGQHQPDLIIDESQDYPAAGWVEVHETVLKDHVNRDGESDFLYHIYGVHSGDRASGFHKRINQGGFHVTQVTAMQRPGWSAAEKTAAKAAYGGTQAPDYKRNILGEAGAAASAIFVMARLMATIDQDRESEYNRTGYVFQEVRFEEFEELQLPVMDVLDLPSGLHEAWAGMDLGLTNAPTVITLFDRCNVKNRDRLKLVRRIHLERFRTKQIRQAVYAIAHAYGSKLKGFGMDETGLGFPIWQEMEDDEAAPDFLKEVARGYFFNSKVPVDVQAAFVTKDGSGRLRDQYGSAVEEERDPYTGETRFITRMMMIEASTRYLREMVDTGLMMLPFDPDLVADMQGETAQRVARVSGLKRKPDAFHILDSMRAMAMSYKAAPLEAALKYNTPTPVFELSF